MKARKKIRILTFIDVDIFYQVVSLHMLYSVNLTHISRLTFINVNITETVRTSVKMGTDILTGRYSKPNSNYMNVVPGDLDLNFQGQTLKKYLENDEI